jgi:copper resistance protein B
LTTFYDVLLTQRLILQPQIELNFYSKSDPGRAIGPGGSDLMPGFVSVTNLPVSLRPNIGVVFEDRFGGTAAFARSQGESVNDVRFVFGIRSWF